MKIENIIVRSDASLKPYNTYRINGKSKYFIEAKNIDELIKVLKHLKNEHISYFIIGNGSNIVIDDYFDGAIIKLTGLNEIKVHDNKVVCGAGAMMASLATSSINANLEGLEWAINIPGTVGGSIVGNAGAYNSCMFDNLISIKILDENLEIKEVMADSISHEYRNTSLKQQDVIVLEGTFKLTPGSREELLKVVEDRRERRMASQPLELPSAGSVFRNPEGDYAGRLIEDVGLKGKTVGGASVSEKHANFIVNNGGATSEDIRNLIKLVHDAVLEKHGIDLVLEQEIIDWK